MKKIIIFLLAVLLSSMAFLVSQEDETLKEKVKVVNVEVPVRVYYQDKPVDNLTKDDFEIYEGKKLQTINGFFIKRKRINVQTLESGGGENNIPALRYFVLVFKLTDYNKDIEDGVNHFFNNILNPTDQLLVFVNNKNQFYDNLEDKTKIKELLNQVLIEQSREEKNQMFLYLKRIEQELDVKNMQVKMRTIAMGEKDFIKNFLEKYLMIWVDYKKRYLVPNIDSYYLFAKHLEKIQKEKWVINIHQMEIFPQIMLTGDLMRDIRGVISNLEGSMDTQSSGEDVSYARMLSKLLMEIEKEMKVSESFPAEEVSKLFYKSNTTFHSIYMRSRVAAMSQEFEYQKISSDLEKSLSELTRRTGGILLSTNKLDSAFNTISEKDDLYYLLTYAPKNPEKIEKIKVEVKNRKYKILFDDTIRAGFMSPYLERKEISGPPVKIDKLTFQNKQLTIELSDFYLMKTKREAEGKLRIRIRINNIQEIPIFDQSKDLATKQNKVKVSLDFSGITPGKYEIVVDVTDLFTNKTSTELLQTTVLK